MKHLFGILIGIAAVWCVVEYFPPKTAMMVIGVGAISGIVGMQAEIDRLKKVIDRHAERIFPELFD